MNDHLMQEWSDALSEIRQSRLASLGHIQKEKGRDFSPKDLVNIAKISLDDAIARWWTFEQESLGGQPTGDPDVLASEMESVIDFEMDAIQRDLDTFQKQTGWNAKAIESDMIHLQNFSEEIKKRYHQKIRTTKTSVVEKNNPLFPPLSPYESSSMADLNPPRPPDILIPPPPPPNSISPPPPLPRAPRRSGGSSSGSGVVMFLMLLVGLLVGSGPSIYFWDQANKSEGTTQEKIVQLQSEKRALEDNVALIQKKYSEMARGKKKTIPQLEESMRPIQEEIAGRRAKVEKEYQDKKENLIRRTPAGERWDRADKKLKENRDSRLADLEAEEKNRLEPYLKQIQILKELLEK